MNPMPAPPPPPLTYSLINYHALPAFSYEHGDQRLSRSRTNGTSADFFVDDNGYNMTELDYNTSEPSTVPTYYNEKIEIYKESTATDSLIENEFDDSVRKLSNEQMSYMFTKISSVSDMINNASSTTRIDNYLANGGNSMAVDDNNDFRETNDNLVNLQPQAIVSDNIDAGNVVHRSATHESNGTSSGGMMKQAMYAFEDSNLAAAPSVASSALQPNRYCVETSFDLETPTMAPTSTFGSSQRLSPVSSSYDAHTESKLGSRVYLETSFE